MGHSADRGLPVADNVVARAFWLTQVDTTGLANTAGVNANTLYAQDQAAPLLTNQGLRDQYYWGMYSVCGGVGQSGARACSPNQFGHRFEPLLTFQEDAPQGTNINQLAPAGVFQDSSYLGRFSNAAFYLLFIGTILVGLAFIIGILSNRFAFLLAALLALAGAACLAVGAAIWTAIIARVRKTLQDNAIGVAVYYGRSIWMAWASFGAAAIAFPFLIISCCVGRDKY